MSSSILTAVEVKQKLIDQLAATREDTAVSRDLAQIADDRGRLEYAYELLKQRDLLPVYRGRLGPGTLGKDDKACLRLMRMAEDMPKRNKNELHAALSIWTSALAHAPCLSKSLGKAYEGRSDVLYELGLFDNCKQDLQFASECGEANASEIKSKLERLDLTPKVKEDKKCVMPHTTQEANSAIACAGDSVSIMKTVDCGRCVVATKDIQIGEVIAVEKPFVAIVLPDSDVSTTHCHECLRLNYALIPCGSCAYAMYCSLECKTRAWSRHHQFECPMVWHLKELQVSFLPALFALRLAIVAAPTYGVIETYSTGNDIREEKYESDRYKEIHNLCTNTHLRSVADLFSRAVVAAMIYEVVELYTTFFTTANDLGPHANRAAFKEVLMRHMQTGPSNFHQINEKLMPESTVVDIGGGAYSFLSMINHSCAPNIVRHCYGSATVLRAIRRIRRGEEVFDNYGFHFALTPKAERQKELKFQYYFECTCQACNEDWPLYGDLKDVEGQPNVSAEEIAELQDCDREGLGRKLSAFIVKARALESVPQPCRNTEVVQECIKECYSILANTRLIDE